MPKDNNINARLMKYIIHTGFLFNVLLILSTLIVLLNIFFYFQIEKSGLIQVSHFVLMLLIAITLFLAFIYVIKNKDEKSMLLLNKKIAYDDKFFQEQQKMMSLLINMTDKLQTCHSIEDVLREMMIMGERILKSSQGILYLINQNERKFEAISTWGDVKNFQQYLSYDECLGILQKNIHNFDVSFCDHINPNEKNKMHHLCLSLHTEKQMIGLLHIAYPQSYNIHESTQLLLSTLVKSSAIAIANIRTREDLENQSIHDPLTGLYNRRYLNDYLFKQLKMAERKKTSLAIILFDIDYFKEYNDSYGHDVGDQVLKVIGELLEEESRSSDIICRYGGEEFLWVMYDCNEKIAQDKAEMLRKKIAKVTINYEDKLKQSITISLGIAVYPQDALQGKALIKAADKALYEAKETGRNKVVCYSALN